MAYLPRRNLRPFHLVLLSTTALHPLAALAQEQTVVLPAITVEGEGDDSTEIVAQSYSSGSKMQTDVLDSAASVSVVTAAEIEKRGASDLEDVLSYSAGVVTDEWGGGDDRYDTFRIRGFDELALGTYRDGLPIRGFGWTYTRREPYGYDRVEVLKGSNSALFGLNAPGGLVNAVSKTPKDHRFGEVYTTLGDNHLEFGTDFGDVLTEDGNWSYRVTAKWQDGERTYDHSNDDRAYLGLGLTWAPTDATSVTFLLDHNDRRGTPGTGLTEGMDADPSSFFGEPDFNRVDTSETAFGWMAHHDFGGGLSFDQVARYSRFDMTYEQVYGATTDPTADRSAFAVYSSAEQFAIDNRLQYDYAIGTVEARTLFGLEYNWVKVDETALYGTADGIDYTDPVYCGTGCISLGDYIDWEPELTTTSVYAQQELTFADRWILTGGARYDWVDLDVQDNLAGTSTSQSFENASGRLGLTYKVSPDLSVYANYSQSFEPPSPFDGIAEPTEGRQYEAGVKYRPAGTNLLLTAAIFDLEQSNVLTQTGPLTYETVGKIGVRGLELEAKGQLTQNLSIIASYSYWDGEIRENGIAGNEGNRPAFVPEHVASLWLDYTLPEGLLPHEATVGLGARYVGQSYADNANTVSMPGRTVLDMAATYAVAKDTELSVNVSNLLDKTYMTADYYGSLYYGEGREIGVTLRKRW